MSDSNTQFSRSKKQQKKRQDRILNMLIAAVVIGIIVVATFILKNPSEKPNEANTENQTEEQQSNETQNEQDEKETSEDHEDEQSEEDDKVSEKEQEEDDETEEKVKEEESDDPVVDKSVVDSSWTPIGTKQQGEHVSVYDGTSVDWHEKIDALAYATDLNREQMIVHWLKNGGGPDKSIGIVSSNDQSEKYRVYLVWVDGEGWKPEKVDVLNTLQFNYK